MTSGQWLVMFWLNLRQVGVGEIERDMNAHTGTYRRAHIKSDEINTDEGRLGKYAEPN